jgi:hypothetical protein
VNGDGIQCLRKWNVSWWKVFQFIIQLGTRIKKMQTHSCVRAISSCSLNSIRNLGGKNSSSRRGTVEILTICILIMEMRSRRCLFEYLENNYLKILGVQFEYCPPLPLHRHIQMSPLDGGKIRVSRGRWHIMPEFTSSADATLFTEIFRKNS